MKRVAAMDSEFASLSCFEAEDVLMSNKDHATDA